MIIPKNEYVIVILCKKNYLKCQITYNINQVNYYYLFTKSLYYHPNKITKKIIM